MNRAIQFLKDNININDTLIVAVSGGPDSMCLLNLVIENFGQNKIVVAHVNHNVRSESDSELIFVRDYSSKHNLIFESMKIESYGKNNFESEARDKRYKFFDKLQKKYNAKYLLTAHHGDDLIETILMRIVRGSNLKGYSGIKPITHYHDYIILRPLLFVTKNDILEYNKKNKIKYVLDYTNELDMHTRNRYRKYILPKLKDEEKNVHLKFLKYSNLLTEYDEYINIEVNKAYNKTYKNNVLDISLYKKLPHLIQILLIHRILENIYGDKIVYINDKNVNNIYDLIYSDKSNVQINLPKAMVAGKSYDKFYIKKLECIGNYEFEVKNKLFLPNNHVLEKVKNDDSDSNFICRLSLSDITLPIIVRTKKTGDLMAVKNMNGHKKVKDIFIDSKVAVNDRFTWPIVVDGAGNILWIPGIKKSKYCKQKNEKYDIILKYY